MRKIAIISIVVLISLSPACTPGRVIINALPSEYIGQSRPVDYAVSYAQSVVLSDRLNSLIQQRLQEYIADKEWWSKDSKEVKLSITITNVETPSSFDMVLADPSSPFIPPGKISGEVIVYYEDKEIGKYKVNASYHTFWPLSSFVDLEDKIAGQFASRVMEALR